MKHKDIIYVEFQRVGQQVKNFDISIVRKDVSPELFKSIDKAEMRILNDYFERANIKVKKVNDRGEVVDFNELDLD